MRSRLPVRRLTVIAVLVLLSGWVATVAAVVARGNVDQARPADAIVVLGAAQYVGRPSPVLRARLDHGIDLWKRGLAAQLIVTGGTGPGDTTSEAAVGRRYAIKHGVPASAILLEAQGRTTSESMRGVAALMRERKRTRVILVSDPFHMLRLGLVARRFGLTGYTSPTRTSPISANPSRSWSYVLAESVKVPVALLTERG
jgi:uncharacterized SAM-binding protein YcdF (DUF218 family)